MSLMLTVQPFLRLLHIVLCKLYSSEVAHLCIHSSAPVQLRRLSLLPPQTLSVLYRFEGDESAALECSAALTGKYKVGQWLWQGAARRA